jgi:hypothetical protein
VLVFEIAGHAGRGVSAGLQVVEADSIGTVPMRRGRQNGLDVKEIVNLWAGGSAVKSMLGGQLE